MKVLNLRCANGHGFEGWFGSDDDFMDQNGRGLIECPLCGDAVVSRTPSAPRLNLSGAKPPREPSQKTDKPADKPADAPADAASAAPPAHPVATRDGDMQLAWLQAVHHVLRNTEDVGERFPEEARRIHYGETEHRGIRGQASPAERAALADEGIEVMPIPMPAGLKGPLQ